ncbi:transcription termination/antitermination protein NusA [Mycoplasma flocculare]|uniref:Transcription termination/antitermination protein NusA n=1 Tax=Mesomycoplasma flocculare TaxID=2128 RepID=A0AAW9XDF4_MESFC|nr:transcription termination/antitermination protein NusA [Mesomycoplasma flocculare]MXR39583.1 transcription termination/antitermination protein NusA [Mycoplasma sp. MF12]MXR05935.1 transcription termination/antitermination protein NusA [Mesomycoplasma flocculare]MXR12404.1 transcription termination/antitermination protein NusA [Mesomycoplasma flocculare]MXR56137.1 transcription termination/antitermination protein NusA [Mesomycoplasma flocculare]MXR56758.1 transcription termination/antitermin
MDQKKKEKLKISPKDSAKLIVESIKEVAKNNELPLEKVIWIFQEAIEFVITKKIDPDAQIQIDVDFENSSFKVFNSNGIVVEDDYFNGLTEEEKINEVVPFISLSTAKESNPDVQVGDIFTIEINLESFEQWLFMAIMHAFKQKISEIVRSNVYNKYSALKNQVVWATVTNKISAGFIFEIDEDKTSAFMPSHYTSGQNLKIGTKHEVVIENVSKNTKQSQVVVSSRSVQLVKKKIIDAIPELQSKFLEIASIARIPGEKCKVAIRKTNDVEANDISEIGSVVGATGTRIFAISQELDGEKIEIVKYDDNIVQFIVNAMSPARVICVKELKLSHKLRRFTVVVPDFQHSLAIGKRGSNVKLTADLTRTQLQILPYSAVLKNDNFQIEWNGNIKDHQELINLKNEYIQRQQNRMYQNQRNLYNHNSDNFESILQQFESDIRELEKPYGVERQFIQKNGQKTEKKDSEFSQTRTSFLNKQTNKLRNFDRNQNKYNQNLDYFSYSSESELEKNYDSLKKMTQKSFFDADSLFDSALNEAKSENELIDKKHQENESRKQELLIQEIKNKNKPNQVKSTKSDADNNDGLYIQNEKQLKNFKLDDDLVKYTGVEDIDIDDLDF